MWQKLASEKVLKSTRIRTCTLAVLGQQTVSVLTEVWHNARVSYHPHDMVGVTRPNSYLHGSTGRVNCDNELVVD